MKDASLKNLRQIIQNAEIILKYANRAILNNTAKSAYAAGIAAELSAESIAELSDLIIKREEVDYQQHTIIKIPYSDCQLN